MADTKQSSGILGKPIEQMKVAELSVQLQNRGLSTSGRKAELVERLKKAIQEEDEALLCDSGDRGEDPNTSATDEDLFAGTTTEEELPHSTNPQQVSSSTADLLDTVEPYLDSKELAHFEDKDQLLNSSGATQSTPAAKRRKLHLQGSVAKGKSTASHTGSVAKGKSTASHTGSVAKEKSTASHTGSVAKGKSTASHTGSVAKEKSSSTSDNVTISSSTLKVAVDPTSLQLQEAVKGVTSQDEDMEEGEVVEELEDKLLAVMQRSASVEVDDEYERLRLEKERERLRMRQQVEAAKKEKAKVDAREAEKKRIQREQEEKEKKLEVQMEAKQIAMKVDTTNILCITNLRRPYTKSQICTDLLREGQYLPPDDTVWLSRDRSMCFVMYPTVEMAAAVSLRVDGSAWPRGNKTTQAVVFVTLEQAYEGSNRQFKPRITLSEPPGQGTSQPAEERTHYHGNDTEKEIDKMAVVPKQKETVAIETADTPEGVDSTDEQEVKEPEEKKEVKEKKEVVTKEKKEVAAKERKEVAGKEKKEVVAKEKKEVVAKEKKGVVAKEKKEVEAGEGKEMEEVDHWQLFKKTKAFPHLYWLPLTAAQAEKRSRPHRPTQSRPHQANQGEERSRPHQANQGEERSRPHQATQGMEGARR